MRIFRWRNKTIRPITGMARRGVILVVVLWVLVILAVLTLGLARDTGLDNTIRQVAGENVRARWLARAGVYRAMSELANDVSENDTPFDDWYDNEDVFKHHKLEGGYFTVYADRWKEDNTVVYGVMDEAAKLNLNTATEEMLMVLPEMTQDLAAKIVQWRHEKKTTTVVSPGAAGTASDVLSVADFSTYLSQHKIQSMRELPLLFDIDRKLLYGEDTNLSGILEENENDGDKTPPADNQDDNLDRGLMAYATVYSYELNRNHLGRKRININTAPFAALAALPGIRPGHVRWIIRNRPYENSIADLLAPEEVADELGSGPSIRKVAPESVIQPDVALFIRIADDITITDDEVIPGRININTAGKLVLGALPGLSDALVQSIMDERIKRATGFKSIADILLVPGMTKAIFIRIAPWITVRSNVFTIHSIGRTEKLGITHKVEVVFARSPDPARVLYWKESR